jgi:hypothetical protein
MIDPMLTGKELLAKVKETSGASKATQAKLAGYVRTVQSGESEGAEVVDVHGFLSALAEAHGITFGNGVRGLKSNGLLKVNGSGQVIVGPAYLKKLGIAPGNTVTVEAVEDTGELVLAAAK